MDANLHYSKHEGERLWLRAVSLRTSLYATIAPNLICLVYDPQAVRRKDVDSKDDA